ncbi:P-loop containing nucleoside triphosphate hydrolase protein [Ceratobasidium sp. AG-I]|nr:P-loop containing nucleoside triphosphate hydrolase protein [Ceratobasidium sp. AG-I]
MGNQLVFDEPSNESKVQHLVLFVPAICALVSVISLLVQKYLYDLDIRKTLFARSLSNASVVPAPTRLTSSGFPLAEPRRAKNSYQETRTTFWKILRLVSCLVLVTLSIIKGGERIGVVGGTGCGKSALVLALLRKIPAQGEIHYDGILTSIIDPDLLRNSIGIISRESPITSATIRQNLDPLGLHDDAVLNSALSFAGLDFKKSRSHLRLDTLVTASGGSLPAEHREIIALARATVQRNKLVILDNVTDGIESIVLSNPPTELGGATLLVITDRLRAICDMDKIIVLDGGEIAEFDTPRALIKVEGGVFKLLVDEDQDRDELHAILNSES